jgi:WD40 repeat protein
MPLKESEALIRTLTGHSEPVRACAISPAGSLIVSASTDKTVKVWDAAIGAERLTLKRPHGAGLGLRY